MQNSYQNSGYRVADVAQEHTEIWQQGEQFGKMVLNYILSIPYEFGIMENILIPASFVSDEQKKIAKAIFDTYAEQGKFDLPTIAGKTNQSPLALHEIYSVQIDYDFESVCNLLAENYKRRTELEISMMIVYAATNGVDADDIRASIEAYRIESRAYDIGHETVNGARQLREWMLKRINGENTNGIAPAHEALKEFIPIYEGGDLVYIGGRAKMGKTNYVLCEALHKIRQSIPVGFFSLEMMTLQLYQRLAGMLSQIPITRNFPNGLADGELDIIGKTVDELEKMPLFVYDDIYDLIGICAKAHKMVKQDGVKMIIIDYVQLMKTSEFNGSREQQISLISRTIKLLAKRLNVPIFGLVQLSRQVEIRGGSKRPQMHDMRESGAFEMDGDFIIFPYRAEYYGILEDEEGNSLKGIVEIIIAGNRHGDTGICKLKTERGNVLVDLIDEWNFDDDSKQTQFPMQNQNNPMNNIITKRPDTDAIPF